MSGGGAVSNTDFALSSVLGSVIFTIDVSRALLPSLVLRGGTFERSPRLTSPWASHDTPRAVFKCEASVIWLEGRRRKVRAMSRPVHVTMMCAFVQSCTPKSCPKRCRLSTLSCCQWDAEPYDFTEGNRFRVARAATRVMIWSCSMCFHPDSQVNPTRTSYQPWPHPRVCSKRKSRTVSRVQPHHPSGSPKAPLSQVRHHTSIELVAESRVQ